MSQKKLENFSLKLQSVTEVENGFFLLNVQGKIEMLNLFILSENNMGSVISF